VYELIAFDIIQAEWFIACYIEETTLLLYSKIIVPKHATSI
jgi:hypothetical protein